MANKNTQLTGAQYMSELASALQNEYARKGTPAKIDEYNRTTTAKQVPATTQITIGGKSFNVPTSGTLKGHSYDLSNPKGAGGGIEIFQDPESENIVKIILGTAGEAAVDVGQGFMGFSEGIADWVGHNVIYPFARATGQTENDLKWYRKALNESTTQKVLGGVDAALDEYSVLGHTSDAVMQGVGQFIPIIAGGKVLQAAGVGATAANLGTKGMMGLSAMGSAQSEAYAGGATDGEALAYGAMSAGSELLFESLFGGMGKALNMTGFNKGALPFDDMAAKAVSKFISSPTGKNIAQMLVKGGFEGLEEVGTGFAQAVAKKLTYMSEEEFGKILKDENLFEQFIVGALVSDIAQAGDVRTANKTGTDLVTGFTKNEQAVIDKEVENRITQEEKGGKKLSGKEKSAIYKQVVRDMKRGYISTETIESVLGKDALTQYDALSREAEEFKTLYETEGGKLSEKQKDRLAELKEKNKNNPYEELLKTQREKISKDVSTMAQNDRLGESYREQTRKGEKFQADVSKYSEAQRKTVQNAIDSGILNNTNRSHEFVDLIAKISADKGISFDFADNAKLKESGFAMDGVLVNGFVNENGVTINVQSAKALNRVVGHEITHVLEGTQLYDALQSAVTEYAKGKKEYDSRLKELTELYKGKNANVEQELVADLVGDYLFTDADFIKHLSTEHRNLAQKIYDEIKYLCKIVTAGTKEARQLEKVKKAFADAYRAEKNTGQTDGVLKYSLSDGTTKNASELSRSDLEHLLESAQNGELSDNSFIPLRRNTPEFFIGVVKEHSKGSIVIEDHPMAATVEHLRQNMDEEDGQSYGNSRPHGFSTDDIITMTEKMGDPSYIVLQKNGRYAEVVSFYNKRNKQVVVAIDFADSSSAKPKNYKYSQYMNGYGGGYYNIIVTQYEPDNLAKYLKGCEIVYSKKEMNGRYQVGSGRVVTVTHDTPFIENIVTEQQPGVKKFSLAANERKAQQLAIILESNPMWDDYHTGIRSMEDIHTWEEVLEFDDEREGQFVWGDFSREDAENALKNNSITVYSSHPISNGTFVSTSYIQAWEYAGGNKNSKVYSKEIPLADVAWINGDEGQYARIADGQGATYSLSKKDFSIAPPVGADVHGKDIGYDIAPPIPESVLRANKPRPKVGDPAYAPIAEGSANQAQQGAAQAGKQRKWVKTSTESDAVNRQILPDELDATKITYEPVSNKKTLGNANAKLETMGYDGAVEYFNNQIYAEKVSLDDIALGERLIQEAIKMGDTTTAGDLIQNIVILGTELGQKVQALSIIQRLTPEGQLKMLQKIVNRGKAKGDNTFNGVEITQDMIDHILSVYGKDGSYDQNNLNRAVEEVKQQIADQMTATKMEKVNGWRYLSMLGNPKTHIRNILSNLANMGTIAVKDTVARTIESVIPVDQRTKTWKPASSDVKDFAKKTTEEMKDQITGEGKYNDTSDIKAKRDTFNAKILQRVYGFNSDLLSKEDWWFSKPAFKQSFQEFLTANGVETAQDIQNNPKLVEKAKKYALERAEIATFRQASWLASKLSSLEKKNAATQVIFGSVIPFKKTPINVAKAGLSYSPLGFAKTLTYDIVQVKKGNMAASELVDHLAQNLTGTGLALVGYWMARIGFLNGAGEDDKEGTYDYYLGEQAYSVNIGKNTYSLSWLSPTAMPLFVGANLYEQLVEGKEWNADVVLETLAQTLDPMSEMSFLSSLDDVLSSYDSGMEKFAGIGVSALSSYASQFIPTALSQTAATIDDTKRTTKVAANSGSKVIDEVVNQMMYKIPLLRQLLQPSTDIWGNEIKQSENVVVRALENFVAPWSRKENISSAVDDELKELYSEVGEDGVLPGIPENTVTYKGKKCPMSAAEFTAYKETYGQTAYKQLEKLFQTTTYRNAAPADQSELVSEVYKYASDVAKKEYLAGRDVEYTNTTKDNVPIYKENAIKGAIENDMIPEEYDLYRTDYPQYTVSKAVGGYEAYKGYRKGLSNIKADKDQNGETIDGSRKKKVQAYINGLDAGYYEKLILWKHEYPSDDTYNAEIINYLNSRKDISKTEMKTILEELGFKVSASGKITWD